MLRMPIFFMFSCCHDSSLLSAEAENMFFNCSAEISSSEKDGTLIVEVVCEAAQRHRYTFSEV